MSTIEKICLLYAVAGAVIGVVVASSREIEFHWRGGSPSRYPRLFAGLASAVFWPLVAFKLFVG